MLNLRGHWVGARAKLVVGEAIACLRNQEHVPACPMQLRTPGDRPLLLEIGTGPLRQSTEQDLGQ